jgi:hypothetical protein
MACYLRKLRSRAAIMPTKRVDDRNYEAGIDADDYARLGITSIIIFAPDGF